MIKREGLKVGLVFTLPIRDTDAFDRYVNYGTEHFSVSVRMFIHGHREATRFEVVGMVECGVRLWIKGTVPCKAVPEEEDFYVFVPDKVLDEVLAAAEMCGEHGSVETKPHEEEKATIEGLTVEQYIQVMEERMTNLFNEKENRSNRLIPKDHVRFKGIVDRMYDTFKRKNADYGNSFRELYKECGMTYAYGHMREKLERVRSLMKNEAQVKGESMKDSLYDLANYAVLTIMEIERSGHGGVETPPHKDD